MIADNLTDHQEYKNKSELAFLTETLEKSAAVNSWNIIKGKYLGNFPNFEISKLKQQIDKRKRLSFVMMAENPDACLHPDFQRFVYCLLNIQIIVLNY